MLFRSTGLGKTELKGKVDFLERKGDFLIMYVDVVEPVKWRIRAALSFRDLAKIGAACAKAAIIRFFLSPIQWMKKDPEHPGDF
jgi:hypothetical protein